MGTLSSEQQRDLEDAASAGDRDTYYSILEQADISYGTLARGVVNNDTLSGSMANAYMAQIAVRNYGEVITQSKADLTSTNGGRFCRP